LKLYDVKAVARFLDISERRVRQLREAKIVEYFEGCPGLFDLTATNHRYINYLRKRNPESEENIDYNTERSKLVRAKRLNEEFDLKTKEGELHSSADIETVIAGMLINFKTRLMAIPAKLSPALCHKTDKAEIFKILKDNIDDALAELSDFDRLFIERVSEGENSDP